MQKNQALINQINSIVPENEIEGAILKEAKDYLENRSADGNIHEGTAKDMDELFPDGEEAGRLQMMLDEGFDRVYIDNPYYPIGFSGQDIKNFFNKYEIDLA